MSGRPTQVSLGRRAIFKVSANASPRFLVFVAGLLVAPAVVFLTLDVISLKYVALLTTILLVLTGFLLAPTTIEVGADGILVRPSLERKRRFIPIASLEHCAPTGRRGVRLRYYNGVEEILETGRGDIDPDADRAREELYAEISDAMDAWRSNGSSVNAAARVARGTRTTAEWAELLRGIRGGDGDYRSGDLRDEDLWLVLESGAHPEESRAAAAVILRERGDDAKNRIRIAAEASVSPRLRVALTSAADLPEVDDEAVLAAMDDAPASAKKKMKR